MQTFWQDVRYGTRMLVRNPGFTIVVILVLGLGIGAMTSVFSVVDGVLLRALPYKDPDRLVMLFTAHPKWGGNRLRTSGMNFLDWQQQSRSFEDMAVLRSVGTTYRHTEGTDHVDGMCVSGNLFALLGWEPLVGRTFLPEETWPNHHYVVLGYDFWQRRLGSDEAVLGKAITLGTEDAAYIVIGVMPPGIRFLDARANALVDFWIPIDRDLPESTMGGRNCLRWDFVVARLKSGVGVKHAQAEMDGIARRLYNNSTGAPGVNVVPLYTYVVGDAHSQILLAAGAAGLVLLIACANVVNLLLARGLARRREMAMRVTLGAGPLRLLRQALTESMLLSLLGGILGAWLAVGGVSVFRAIAPNDMTRLEEIGINLGTLAFALGVALLTGVIVGLTPALRTWRADLGEALKADGRGATLELGRRRLASLFVTSQVSLSLILLIHSGLLINSLSRLLRLDPGYRTNDILTLGLENMSGDSGPELLRRAKSLPSVSSAALARGLPLCEAPGYSDIRPEGILKVDQHAVTARIVSPGYFGLMGIPFLAGRDFTEDDSRDSPPVTVINESLARRFWPDEDPIGKKFEFAWAGSVVEIVGVVRDTKNAALDAEPILEAFLPSEQQARRPFSFSLVVATESPPMNLVGPLRKEIWSIDANAVIREVRTMADIVGATLAARRFLAVVLSVFSLTAVVLATSGIYGVIAHSVRQRIPEIGIRMALGARSTDVLRSVVSHGLKLTLIGTGIGLAGALALTRVIASLLYDVSPTDPLTFALVSLVLISVAALACYIPARRAARIDPMAALRYE